MKNTALILALIMCFVSYQVFAFGVAEKPPKPPKPQKVTNIKGGENKITGGNNTISGGATTVSEGPTTVNGGPTEIRGGTTTVSGGNIIVPGAQGAADRIPVTFKIVEFMLKRDGSADGLKFYLSKPVTLRIYEQKETKEVEFTNGMVILNPANPADEKIIEFSENNEGKLTDIPGPEKGRDLEIFFQEHGKTLIFRRNVQQNCYELYSVKILDNRSYRIVAPNERPRLVVRGKDNRNISDEVKVVPTTGTAHDNQQQRNVNNNAVLSYLDFNAGNFNDTYMHPGDDNLFAASPRSIMGRGSVSQESVIAYARNKNPSLSRSDIAIINEYFREADGVNVDLAIAQMLYASDCFKNQTRIRNNNFAGFSSAQPGNGTFPNMNTGVKAHIQHLKAYAKETLKSSEIVDPRYSLAFAHGFHGMKFEDLYSRWTASPGNYEENIEAILVGIGSSAARRR
ncbi:MAG: hypothetical protein LBH43_17575 [Treponema sp.]|jgi:hypothetical protein|nr:hypothetical protein [Treponema sp.]